MTNLTLATVFIPAPKGYTGLMTDEEWHQAMLDKLDEWLHKAEPGWSGTDLLRHMFMSSESFCRWRETGHVPKETRLCWVIFDDEIFERIHGQNV